MINFDDIMAGSKIEWLHTDALVIMSGPSSILCKGIVLIREDKDTFLRMSDMNLNLVLKRSDFSNLVKNSGLSIMLPTDKGYLLTLEEKQTLDTYKIMLSMYKTISKMVFDMNPDNDMEPETLLNMPKSGKQVIHIDNNFVSKKTRKKK